MGGKGGRFTRPDLADTHCFSSKTFVEFRVCVRLAGRIQKHPKASRPPIHEKTPFRFCFKEF